MIDASFAALLQACPSSFCCRHVRCGLRGTCCADARKESADGRRLHEVEEHQRARAFGRRQVGDVRALSLTNTAAAESKPVLHLLNLETNQHVEVADASGGTFSPDSMWIAYTVEPCGRPRWTRRSRRWAEAPARQAAAPRLRRRTPRRRHHRRPPATPAPGTTPRRRPRAAAPSDAAGAAAARGTAQSRDRRRQVVAGHSVVHVFADLHASVLRRRPAAGGAAARRGREAVTAPRRRPAARRRRRGRDAGRTARRGRHRARSRRRPRSAARQRRRHRVQQGRRRARLHGRRGGQGRATALRARSRERPRDSARERREALQPPDVERTTARASPCSRALDVEKMRERDNVLVVYRERARARQRPGPAAAAGRARSGEDRRFPEGLGRERSRRVCLERRQHSASTSASRSRCRRPRRAPAEHATKSPTSTCGTRPTNASSRSR